MVFEKTKRKVVSHSNIEVEYKSVVAALVDIILIQSLMHELCITSPTHNFTQIT